MCDGVVVDIGAGFGDFSVLYGKRFSSARIYAFEPDNEYYQLLSANKKINHSTNVVLIHDAVSSLKEIFSRIGKRRIHFLKIDCEGCEFELFQTATKTQLSSIDQIAMEYHEFEGKKVRTIVGQLERAGFSVYVYPQETVDDIGMLYAKRKN